MLKRSDSYATIHTQTFARTPHYIFKCLYTRTTLHSPTLPCILQATHSNVYSTLLTETLTRIQHMLSHTHVNAHTPTHTPHYILKLLHTQHTTYANKRTPHYVLKCSQTFTLCFHVHTCQHNHAYTRFIHVYAVGMHTNKPVALRSSEAFLFNPISSPEVNLLSLSLLYSEDVSHSSVTCVFISPDFSK